MGCIAGKTSHTDTADTESTITTISCRGNSFSYDDYLAEQDLQEEKEIEAELQGKKTKTKKTVKNKDIPKRQKTPQKNGKKNGRIKQKDANHSKELENSSEKGEESFISNHVVTDANMNKVDATDSELSEHNNSNMGNIEPKLDLENSDNPNTSNNTEKVDTVNDQGRDIQEDESLDDHHVHWQDEKPDKSKSVKGTPRDQDLKLMPNPSERVMSAHVRRASARQSAGKERQSSLRHSAGRDRLGSSRPSTAKERRGSKPESEKYTKDVVNEEQKMEDKVNGNQDFSIIKEEGDNYEDVEEMIRNEQGKDGEEDEDDDDDFSSFNDDEMSTSQMTDRAPSLSLWYDDNVQGDILTTQVYVPSFGLTRHTYYCCLQWNSGRNGGGYCGLQDHENGRNYIFSIWDPIDSEGKIKPVYIGPGTTCEPFGGEGTGLKSWNFDLGWEPDCWYTMVTRRWDHEGHTRYGLWVKHHLECFWTHIVTLDFPLPGIYYDTWTCSFIEDWEGTGYRVRRAHLRNGYKRKLNGQWVPFDKAVLGMVKELSSRRYRGNFDAGTFDEMYFLQSGGESIPTDDVTEGSCFYAVSDEKPTEVPISCVLTKVTAAEMVWEVSEGSVPQFQYAVKVDGEIFKQEVNSEMRVCKFDIPPKKLVEIYVEDILGRSANAKFVVREKLTCKMNGIKSER